MLQFPTNVYPHNNVVDVTVGESESSTIKFTSTFTFNGDRLSWRSISFFKNDNMEEVATYYYGTGKPTAYNGDTVRFSLNGEAVSQHFQNGKSYVMRYLMAQTDENGNNIYDMYVGKGKLTSNSTDKTILKLKNKINNIYAMSNNTLRTPIKQMNWNDEEVISYGMVIEINDERHIITEYNYTTGVLTVDSAFECDLKKDTEYKLYSNYIITPYYFFKTRTIPTLSSSIELTQSSIVCNGIYSQTENTPIKYFEINLNRTTPEGDLSTLSTGRVYSQNLNYTFNGFYSGATYQATIDVVTQDNQLVHSASNNLVIENGTTPLITDATVEFIDSYASNKITWNIDSSVLEVNTETIYLVSFSVYRKNLSTNEMVYIGSDAAQVFGENDIEKTNFSCVDFTIQNNKSYQYIIKCKYNDTIYQDYVTEISDINYIGWTISKLQFNDAHNLSSSWYTVLDTWRIIGEIQNTTITQNMSNFLHIGTAKYPVLSQAETNYASGTLTALLGVLKCPDMEWIDDIELVEKWRKFITGDNRFLLKSQKGDIWVIVVTESPYTEYDESYYKVPTTFTFSWAEVEEVDSFNYRGTIE